MMLYAILFLLLPLQVLAYTIPAAGDPYPWVGRYSKSVAAPLPTQLDPLSVPVSLHFPSNVRTVGDAVQHLLAPSGYSLSTNNLSGASQHLDTFLGLPLPVVHRSLGPVTVEQGLETLVGFPWTLIVDPMHRQVSFELSLDYFEVTQPSSTPNDTSRVETPSKVLFAAVSKDLATPPASPASSPETLHDGNSFDPQPFYSDQLATSTTEQVPRSPSDSTLSDHITPNIRNLQLKEAFETILPGWRIDLFLSDPEIANARINLTTEGTRESLLDVLEDRLYTKYGVFLYRFSNRHPPVLIITDERP